MATPFTNAKGESYVTEIQWNGYDSGLTPAVVDVLSKAQTMVDFPIVLRSGARDPARNAKVGGAKASEHIGGNAVDISLKGLSNQQRTMLTRALVQAGGRRIGAYSGNTGLHLDMKDQAAPKGYPVWPMFDRTIRNMDKAPAWFTAGLDGSPIPPGDIAGPAPTPADMPSRIASARLGADDAGIGTAFSQLERFGQPGANPLVMSDEMAYATGRNRDVPLPRARPAGPMADVPLPRPRVSPPTTPSPSLSSGIVDSTRSPTLLPGGVGVPNEHVSPSNQQAFQVLSSLIGDTSGLNPSAHIPSRGTVSPNQTTIAGRPDAPVGSMPSAPRSTTTIAGRPSVPGSLPAARPQTTITGRPDAPVGSMPARSAPDPAGHDQMMAARNPVPRPSVFRTAGGIAGTAQMPADYRPNVPQITPPPSVPKTIPNPAFKDTSFTQSPYYTGGAASVPKTIPNPAYKAPAPMASPMPATQSPSLAVQRATAAPTNFIQAGQYTYVKGPNGYERVNAPTPVTQSAGLAASRNVLTPPRTSTRAGSSSGSSGTRITNSSGTGAFGTSSSGRKYNADTNRWEYA